jgi:hypothetical protein
MLVSALTWSCATAKRALLTDSQAVGLRSKYAAAACENRIPEAKAAIDELVELGLFSDGLEIAIRGECGGTQPCDRKACREELTAYAISKGSAPWGKDFSRPSGKFTVLCESRSTSLSAALSTGCASVVSQVAQNLSPHDLEDSVEILSRLPMAAGNKAIVDPILSACTQKSCRASAQIQAWLQGLADAELAERRFQEERQADEKRKSELVAENDREEREYDQPSGIKKRACQAHLSIGALTKAMGKERETEKIGGVVNLKAKYELATGIRTNREELVRLKRLYRKKTGKEISLSNCKPESEN